MARAATATCFYERTLPAVDEIVMVRTVLIDDSFVQVQLLEYGDLLGMVVMSEMTRKDLRTASKLVKIGKEEPAVVVRVDPVKMYVDLSKRRVTPQESAECRARFSFRRLVHSIVTYAARVVGVDHNDLYTRTVWQLDRQKSVDVHAVLQDLGCGRPPPCFAELQLSDKERSVLQTLAAKHFKQEQITVHAEFHIGCVEREGVEAIKAAIKYGLERQQPVAVNAKEEDAEAIREKEGNSGGDTVTTSLESSSAAAAGAASDVRQTPDDSDARCTIKLIAAPLFLASITTFDSKRGVTVLSTLMDDIHAEILRRGGTFVVVKKPQAVTREDQHILATRMRKMLDISVEDGITTDDGVSADEGEDELL